ncbi:hypothetical protein [Actinomadura darangshiensis]|uniref:hypothetical protein n=1 Tax=Actinomadura darangshiensis TaxID=705336 RepID=UPI001A9F332F|nr:hypothetical protein [Actinomadura darangshiensis]
MASLIAVALAVVLLRLVGPSPILIAQLVVLVAPIAVLLDVALLSGIRRRRARTPQAAPAPDAVRLREIERRRTAAAEREAAERLAESRKAAEREAAERLAAAREAAEQEAAAEARRVAEDVRRAEEDVSRLRKSDDRYWSPD